MSQQILRNRKVNKYCGIEDSYNNDTKKNVGSKVILTKIKNPLSNQFQRQQVRKDYGRQQSLNTNVNLKQQSDKSDNKQSIKTNNRKINGFQKKQNLQQPSYRFYADRFNLSSDDSFMLDQSMRESQRKMIEKSIDERFKNSRREIQQLFKKTNQNQEKDQTQHQFGGYYTVQKDFVENQRDTVFSKVVDKKQAKRKKLRVCHCDSIIVRPEFHPTKVFQLSITPTINHKPTTHFQVINISSQKPREINPNHSFSSNSKYNSGKKSIKQNSIDSLNQSPLEKLNDSKNYYQIQSPSFIHNKKQRSKSDIEQTSFLKQKYHQKKNKIFSNKNQDLQESHQVTKRRQLNNNRHQYQKCKNEQVTNPTYQFKRRTKIFSHDKKSGLKLSRAIMHQQEINKLKGEMGVDFFHIVIEQEEILRQCCT